MPHEQSPADKFEDELDRRNRAHLLYHDWKSKFLHLKEVPGPVIRRLKHIPLRERASAYVLNHKVVSALTTGGVVAGAIVLIRKWRSGR